MKIKLGVFASVIGLVGLTEIACKRSKFLVALGTLFCITIFLGLAVYSQFAESNDLPVQSFAVKTITEPVVFKPNLILKIDQPNNRYLTTPYVYYFRDPGGLLTLEQVIQQHSAEFKLYEDEQNVKNFGLTEDAIWFALNLKNVLPQDVDVMLQVTNPLTSLIEVYFPHEHIFHKSSAGKMIPISEREIALNTPTFKGIIPANNLSQVYLRVKNLQPFSVPIELFTGDELAEHLYLRKAIEGIIFGMITSLLIYNLFLYYVERAVNYLFIAFYIVAFAGNNLSIHGYTEFIWPNSLYWNHIFNFISASLLMIAVALQAMYYLDLKNTARSWNNYLKVCLIYLILICLPVSFMGSSLLINYVIIPAGVLLILGVFGASIQLSQRGFKPAKIYLVSIIVPAFSALAWLAYQTTVIQSAPYMDLYLSFAIVVQHILLSLGVADRIQFLKVEKVRSENLAVLEQNENRAKSQLLAQMSHEIRTPISGVIGMADVLCEANLTSRQMGYATMIRGAAKQLLGIINNILDYSKLEAGKMELEEVEFSMEEILAENILSYVPLAEEKGLELYYAILSPCPYRVIGDVNKLGQVIQNLIDNAIHYTEQGHVIATIDLMVDEFRNRATLTLVVADTGKGLSLQQQKDIFSDRLSSSLSDEHNQRAGIGLKIVKRYIDLLKGEIDIESESPKGSRFSITLPLKLGREIELPASADLREHKFLFVEKNPAIAHCFELLFFHRHAQVIVAKDSEEANLLISKTTAENNTFRACFIASTDSVTDEFLQFCLDRQIPCIGLLSQSDMIELSAGREVRRLKYVIPKLASFAQFEDAIHHATEGEVSEIPLHTIYEQFDRKNLRVLVAEDNPVNQLVIEKVFAGFGCTITVAKTGKQAVAIFEENPGGFDIVFMDCEMPELNGFEATQRIRLFEAEYQLERTPIVALTAHMDDEVIGHINDQGMDDYLAKPIDRRKIHHKLDKFSL